MGDYYLTYAKDTDKAKRIFNYILAEDDHNLIALLGLFEIYREDNYDQASYYIGRATNLAPENAEIMKAKTEFENSYARMYLEQLCKLKIFLAAEYPPQIKKSPPPATRVQDPKTQRWKRMQ